MQTSTDIKVRGYHLDIYGHVNNARYLEFLEEGRWDMFEKNDLFDWIGKDISFVVVNINISYKKAAVAGDTLQLNTGILSFRSRSSIIRQTVYLKDTDTLIAEADITFVILDSNGKIINIADGIKEKLSPMMISS